ncbi:MAG: PDZ domain-containing protein [Phycisphaerales bacterium]|nr:PDZ domain-containing protein [Phycisphaerales bacterium]
MKLPMMKRCEAQGSAGFAHRAGSRRGARVLAVLTASGLVCAGAMAQSAGGGGGGVGGGSGEGAAEREKGETRTRAAGAGGSVRLQAAAEGEGEGDKRVVLLRGSNFLGPSIELTFSPDGDVDFDELSERLMRISPAGVDFRVDRLGERPSLGVVLSDADPVLLEHLRLDTDSAVMIERVLPGTPAARAGLAANDIVLSIDGEPVEGVDHFRARIGAWNGEGPIAFRIIRRGQRLELSVTPERRAAARGPAVDLSLRVDAEASLAALKETLQRALERTAQADVKRDMEKAIGSVEELSERLSSVRFDVSRNADGRSELRYVDPRTGEERRMVLPEPRAAARGPAVDLSLRVDAEASLAALKEKLQRALERTAQADIKRDVQEAIGSIEELSERLSSVRFDVSRDADGRSELRYVDPRTGQERRMVLPGGAVTERRELLEERIRDLRETNERHQRALRELQQSLPRRDGGAEPDREPHIMHAPFRTAPAEALVPMTERLDRLEASVERLEGKLDRLLEKLSDR